MDFSQVKAGEKLKYVGKSRKFSGTYVTCKAEETYRYVADCPKREKGKLMIIEFKNDGTPMFFVINKLKPNEWELVDGN